MALERWFLRAGAFLLPLAFSWGTYDRFVLPKLLLARVLVVGLLILFVVRTIVTGTLSIKRTPLDLPLLIFILSALLSTVFAYNTNVAVYGTYSRYDGLLTILTYAGLFWLSVQAIASADDAHVLLRILLASGYLVAAIAIVQSISDSTAHGVFSPAFGPLGQKNVLGIVLAMLFPLALRELMAADSWSKRVVGLNIILVIAAGLLLSQSRSAWLGASLGGLVLILARRRPNLWLAISGGTITLVVVGAVVLGLSSGQRFEPRPYIWRDSLALIASRPVFGYGPDNFGLVYPRFQSANLGTQQVDKAHAESLQVAATQGLVGLAAYVVLLAAFVRAFWRGREREGAAAIFAGLVAYQATLQLNFTALAAALPFWIFAAAAMESWGATKIVRISVLGRRSAAVAAAGFSIALAALTVASTARVYLADADLLHAVTADLEGRVNSARISALKAMELAPQESVYAVEVANIAFERGDWAYARDAYLDAARLGTYNPMVYRNLALADRNLGRLSEGRAAARQAVELDRFDPANQALLAEFESPPA